jgi:hypothetical protein
MWLATIRFSSCLSVNHEGFAVLGPNQCDQGEARNVHERRFCVSLNQLPIFHFEDDSAHTLLDYAILIIVSLVINNTFKEKKIGKVKKVNR